MRSPRARTVGRRVHAEPLLRRAGDGVPRAPRRRATRHPRARRQHRQRQRRHRRAGLAARAPTCAAVARLLGCDAAAGAAVFHRRDHGAAAGRADRRRPAAARAPRRATTGSSRPQAIMTTDTVPKACVADGHASTARRHGHRHRQGRRHDPARTWRRCSASSPPMRRSTRRCCSRLAREARRRARSTA